MQMRSALVILILSAAGVAGAAPLSVSVPRLTMESALKVAQASLAECRKKGYQVSVSVVDRNGYPQILLRDTLGPPVSIGIARDKAYTSANFTAASGSLAGSPLASRDGLVMGGGGLPIEAAGQLFGAVGVSGAPGGDIDEACAKAGIEAISEDLEMGDL